MARRRKNSQRSDHMGPFVAVPWELLNSSAYKDMTPSAAKALPYFLGKPKLPFNDAGYHEIIFPFSYSEGDCLGFSKSTFSGVIRALVSKGFLDPVHKGGLRGDGRSCSQFRLSNRWKMFGTNQFKESRWEQFIQKKL